MLADSILRRVRNGERVAETQLKDFIDGISDGSVPDYQATAFLMAIYCRGLDDDLTATLTLAMRDSGHVMNLDDLPGRKVDKHSTGGVGDKISIPLAPIVSACGVRVPMISGRGLGHSGGTLDKLESIPGFRVDLSAEQFHTQVGQLGCALIGQTGNIAPADKKLYALRDVTATVESIPLITSSILSKKLAEGIDALVLDVKVGRGAFMKTENDARRLARSLVSVGRNAGIEVRAILTAMDQPLGRTVGNALEIKESLEILSGQGPDDTTQLTLTLAAHMLVLGHRFEDLREARDAAQSAIEDGSALRQFAAIIEAQGGDPSVIDAPDRLPAAPVRQEIVAPQSGRVAELDAFQVGSAAVRLGAGRARAEDPVDPSVGFEIFKKVGDRVERGEVLGFVHAKNQPSAQKASLDCLKAYRFENCEKENESVDPDLDLNLVIDVLS